MNDRSQSRAGLLIENHFRLQYEASDYDGSTMSSSPSSYQKDPTPTNQGVPFKPEYREVQKMDQPQLDQRASDHKDNINNLARLSVDLTSDDYKKPSLGSQQRDRSGDKPGATQSTVRGLQDNNREMIKGVNDLAG